MIKSNFRIFFHCQSRLERSMARTSPIVFFCLLYSFPILANSLEGLKREDKFSRPKRAWTNIRMYECLVVAKHRLHCIHCPSIPKVKQLFIEDGRLMIGQRRMSVPIKSFWRWKRKFIWKCSPKVQNCWTKKILMSRIILTGIRMKWQQGKAERIISSVAFDSITLGLLQ